LSECHNIGVGGIEVAADPFQPLGMFLVARIGDGIEEVAVSPWTADILWRAASGCFNEARVG
jgi:hypothetical protein